MILFLTKDGGQLDENELFRQWQAVENRPVFYSWLREQVLNEGLTLVEGSHPVTYAWFLKHCREKESQQIRNNLRNHYTRQCLREGMSAKEAENQAREFVQSPEYLRQLEQRKAENRTLQSIQAGGDARLQRKYQEYINRRLKTVCPKGMDALSFLDGLDLDGVFAAAFAESTRRAVEKLNLHLRSQKQYLSVRAGVTNRRRELTPALLPQFLSYYLSNWNQRKLADAMDGMDIETFLKERSMRAMLVRRHGELNTIWLRSDQKRRESILNAVVKRFLKTYSLQQLLEAAAREFTRESVLDALIHNPLYSEMALDYRDNQEQYAQLDRLILDHIPENFVDLYPCARRMRRRFFLHIGPTNSGKTYQALQAFRAAETGIYLAPLRLLAYEIFERTNLEEVPCDMLTGEESIEVPEAKHISCTIEMLNPNQHYHVAVIDEAQMLIDEERGAHWTTAILGVWAEEVHVCAAEHAQEILIRLIENCGDDYTVIEHQRQIPLIAEEEPFRFPESVRPEDALIVFSKSSVLRRAAQLQRMGIRTSVIYGALPYDVRQEEVRKFTHHETDVVVATDAIGMGLNLPIRRVVFLETQKFDGIGSRPLSNTEVKQIAGRAGRRGMYEVGYYNSELDWEKIQYKYEKPSRPFHHVYIDFPESLLALDGNLSYLMEQWNAIPDDELYRKGNITEKMELCTLLEGYSQDKQLIYSFVMIPFAETNRAVRQLWLELFLLRRDGGDVEPLLRAKLPERMDGLPLETLELYYQYGDLFFHYCRRFAPVLCRTVAGRKAEVSRYITEILSAQALNSEEKV